MPSLDQRKFLESHRVGRLATVSADGTPHVVPVCYALVEANLYIVLDEKPKRVEARELKRVRNILDNPKVALVVDYYEDADWARLGWVMARGSAEIIESGSEHALALRHLRARYAQYESMALEESPVIAIRVDKVTDWGDLAGLSPAEPNAQSKVE
jgi:PPOX class probable F420-dependent enzyme